MQHVFFILLFVTYSLAEPRFWNIGFGEKELSDEVYVEINNKEEVRLNLNNGKGSLPLARGGFGESFDPRGRRTISNARISRGPTGVRCFFAGERDDENWISPVFPKYQKYEYPFFATDLWCYVPIDEVVRIMVSKESDKVEMFDVELLEGGQGGRVFGRGKTFTVERAHIVHGPPVTCALNSRPTRPGDSHYSRSEFSSTTPLYELPVPNVASVVCRKTSVIQD